MTVVINNTTIDSDDVVRYGFVSSEVKANSSLVASQCSIYLDIATETQKDKYDDTRPGSLFYGTYWVNSDLMLLDEKSSETIFIGKIKNIEVSHDDNTCLVEATNHIKTLVDTICVYSANELTPAEHIKNIMLNVAAIPKNQVSISSFAIASGKQSGYTCSVTYAKADNITCISVINELLEMSSCDIYDVNSVLSIKQWEQWTDIQGYKVHKEQYVSGYKHWYNYDEIINDVSIAYNTGSVVARYTASDDTSILEYDVVKSYNCPDNGDSTTISDYKILWDNSSSATWAASKKLGRYKDVPKYCTLKVTDEMAYVKLYDQLDLMIAGNVNEPVRVIKITPDLENHTITFDCVFLNLPKSPVTIDRIPPEQSLIIFAHLVKNNTIGLLWTVSSESDSLGYYLYYSTTPGNWYSAASSGGRSPVEVKSPVMINGYCYYGISGLNPGATYYFKLKAFDTRYNVSVDSNIYSARIYSFEEENMYRCDGDIISGVYPTLLNVNNGSLPDDWNIYGKYDVDNYDDALLAPSASYRSHRFTSDTGFEYAIFSGTGDIGDIKIQWNSNGVWSEPVDASPTVTIDLQGETDIIFLVTFYSDNWSDRDTIYLSELKEVL